MNKEQVKDLIKMLVRQYPNFFKDDKLDDTIKMYLEELSQYDYVDVNNRVKELLSQKDFQMRPPTLYHITSSLKKVHDKINWSEVVYFCDNCSRPFDNYNLYMKHRDRCFSVEYVLLKTKQFFGKEVDKKSLYDMSDEEFNSRYNKLLKYIYDNTTDMEEKLRISYCFNPPNQEEAKQFINGNSR